MSANFRFLVIAVVFAFALFPRLISSSVWLCKPCLDESDCNKEPLTPCIYGEVTDTCRRRICGRGPGDKCGGPLNILGTCGEGLMCRNERCSGCSMTTFECFTLSNM